MLNNLLGRFFRKEQFSERGSKMDCLWKKRCRQPRHTNIRIKGSDRRQFILILDSILVYATLIMWMNLSPFPNLRKAEEINSTLRILQTDFYSVYLTHQLFIWLYSKVILFFIYVRYMIPILEATPMMRSLP